MDRITGGIFFKATINETVFPFYGLRFRDRPWLCRATGYGAGSLEKKKKERNENRGTFVGPLENSNFGKN